METGGTAAASAARLREGSTSQEYIDDAVKRKGKPVNASAAPGFGPSSSSAMNASNNRGLESRVRSLFRNPSSNGI